MEHGGGLGGGLRGREKPPLEHHAQAARAQVHEAETLSTSRCPTAAAAAGAASSTAAAAACAARRAARAAFAAARDRARARLVQSDECVQAAPEARPARRTRARRLEQREAGKRPREERQAPPPATHRAIRRRQRRRKRLDERRTH